MQVSYSTQAFMKHAPGQYSAEISELTGGGETPLTYQIYNDSADSGFVLICADTGREVRMVEANTVRDNGETEWGDILYWVFKSDPSDVRRLKIHPITIKVFND